MTRTRKWTLGTALAIVLLLLAGWFLVISPKRSEAAELTDQAAAQEQANTVLRGKIAVLKSQAEDLPAQEAALAAMRQKLPANPALPGLVRSLSSIAAKSGVVLVGIEPQTPVVMTDPAAAAAAAAAAATPTTTTEGSETGAAATAAPPAPELGLKMIPVTIEVTGSYFDIEQFFNKVEDLTRSMLVSGFTIQSDDTAEGATSDLTAEIDARVFFAPVPAPAAAGAAATTATAPTTTAPTS